MLEFAPIMPAFCSLPFYYSRNYSGRILTVKTEKKVSTIIASLQWGSHTYNYIIIIISYTKINSQDMYNSTISSINDPQLVE